MISSSVDTAADDVGSFGSGEVFDGIPQKESDESTVNDVAHNSYMTPGVTKPVTFKDSNLITRKMPNVSTPRAPAHGHSFAIRVG